eukprot:CAMPEP_0172693730 /NCGR_PEP_ID=MMETSP1074-20121228/26203_1 /TAXON_ID=2916 /ORGANISM="Ceratium fusus, Strain PA161109" /LENGTH=36 /DNA_ID= /DNA_START= /DNA_END= /DNA_ORIENTATION=
MPAYAPTADKDVASANLNVTGNHSHCRGLPCAVHAQ